MHHNIATDTLSYRMSQLPLDAQMTDSSAPDLRALSPIRTPERIAVASTRAAHGAAAFALLQSAGLPTRQSGENQDGLPLLESLDSGGSLSVLPEWLVEHPQAHLLLLVPLPSIAVARRLAEGTGPKAALAQWQETAEAVLDVIRPHRRRVSLAFAESALAAPEAFIKSLSRRLQIDLDPLQDVQQASDLPDAVLRMMAENAVWQSSQARNLAAELEATALPLDTAEVSGMPAVEQVFKEYRKRIETPAKAIEDLKEENELLLSQLHQVQEELESHFLKAKQTEEQLVEAQNQGAHAQQYKEERDQARKQLAEVKQQAEQAKAALKANAEVANDHRLQDLQEENDLLLQQLHHVQEELERYYLQGGHHGGELYDLQQRLQAAEATVEALYNSKSWKITKPLRAILDLFTGGSKTG